jgi:hypothetical protein
MADLATITALLEKLPASQERDELLRLASIGAKFQAQQCGRRPGFLRNYVAQLVARLPAPASFADLLDELESEAVRRALQGQRASPVEQVNRVWEQVTIHYPGKGPRKVPFSTLRNNLTAFRKNIQQ